MKWALSFVCNTNEVFSHKCSSVLNDFKWFTFHHVNIRNWNAIKEQKNFCL